MPYRKTRWVWAPGTANICRKSALAIALPNDPSTIGRDAFWDAYILPALHLLTGSVLISKRLSAYRVHGANAFSLAHNLNGLQFTRLDTAGTQTSQRVFLLRTLFLKVNVLNKVLAEDRFWTTIDSLIRVDNLKPSAYFAREDVENALVDAWQPLTEAFGARQLLSELKSRMNAVDLHSVARARLR